MPAPTFDDVYQYAKQVQGISQQAKKEFLEAIKQIDFDDWSRAAKELRELILRLVDYYGLASAELGAQWYEYCRQMNYSRGYTAIVGQPSRYGVKSDCNVVIDKLFDGEISIEEMIGQLSGVVVDQVQKQARDSILGNLNEELLEARRSGDNEFADQIGYARVPVGDTCAFCIMLASRGFVYTSEKTATQTKWGSKYHPNCNCVAVPFHKAHTIPGYGDMLEKYERMYRDADNMRRSGDMPDELKARIKEARKVHNEKYENGEESERWRSYNEITMIMRWQNEGLH